ncbi:MULTISPECIES: glycoside hydrolase domain-containing protein [unclassified Streptomyces]|uniref:glycoside hydrolase domain-containing protein n=1 Tax=unclassified Streptomyces TaxID=2593676 RepID=UPI002E2D4A33|nr:glycoside hydrolase domain-containing protein [Streptomyces sp. NBC_00228]
MADEKVLAAQKWVNSTYSGVSGYARCPEDGNTGWATMYSLIMGLQHELGISPVVASFGDGTLSKVTALGSIGIGWNANENVVKIIRHGLFCKGYWGGDTSVSSFDTAAASSVNQMKSNMGITQDGGVVQAKVFKAILNMDAYVVVAGGTEKVRTIQQWLNGRYWGKSTFSIGPTDGNYSRDVQQALMKAIQIEIGIPESQATGNFGAGTQAGLRAHPVGPGSSGIFMQLFSAACVFNEPVASALEDDQRTHFTDAWDSDIEGWIRGFQKFSALTDSDGKVSGVGDYPTWAQLLVSMGDPDRKVTASDTAYAITLSRGQRMYADGYRYVGRYINESAGGGSKMLEEGELADIFAARLRVFPIFQDNARAYEDFNWPNGYDHGQRAHDQAVHFGFNRGTIIYFAVDYDATDADMPKVVEYFQGVASGLASRGKRYSYGVYGSRNVCAQVTNETYAAFSFVSGMSWGFSGNLGFPLPGNWSFNQIKEFQVTNGSDVFWLDADAHSSGSDEGQGSINQATSPADQFVSYISGLYDLAKAYGQGNPNQLVMEYLRHQLYGDWKWRILIGGFDQGFISYAEDHGASIMADFTDPFSGLALGPEHLMATCNAHFLNPPPSNPGAVNVGDVGGWGGDLFTFYGEWRRDSDSYSSGYTYCMEKLGNIGVNSTFSFEDLVEDTDGYLLAQSVRGGATIVEAVRDRYTGSGGATRFQNYYAGRFGGTVAQTAALAREMLVTDEEPIADGRTALFKKYAGVFSIGPAALPSQKLDEFCQGFAEVLVGHVQIE